MKLILNDGTVIDGGSAGYADGFLWLWLPEWTIQRGASIIASPDLTVRTMSRIIFKYEADMEEVYSGYTVCTAIMQEGDTLAICLVKG